MNIKNKGFTLIEIMIVVAIVGILTAIALPSYNEYIRRGHRADGRAGLLQAAQWLERASTATGTYPTALPGHMTWSTDAVKRYTITIGNGVLAAGPLPTQGASTNAAFTLIAVPKAGTPQAGDNCGNISLTSTGVRGASPLKNGVTVAECWNK